MLGTIRFLKYSTIGGSTFLVDLLLLYVLIDVFQVQYVFASGIAFLIAVSLNYVVSRRFVFAGSLRGIGRGYVNFLLIAGVGLCAVMIGMYVLVGVFSLPYVLSRISIAGITGVWNYLMNLYVNFKVAGKY